MHLNCPDCNHSFQTEDKAVVVTVIKCKSCNNIFEYTDQLKAAGLPIPYKKKSGIIISKGIEMNQLKEEMEIKIDWNEVTSSFSIWFGIYWNLFLLFVTYLLVTGDSDVKLFFALFLIPFYLVGIKFIYRILVYLYNTTFITVNKEMINVEHTPINFYLFKDHHLMTHAIEQLFVRKEQIGEKGNEHVYAWCVDVEMKDGEMITLMKDLKEEKYAFYIEQEIEKYLGIKDRSVPNDGYEKK